MPKPITQRGFRIDEQISKDNFYSNSLSYQITKEGREQISIDYYEDKKMEGSVIIEVGDGEVKRIIINTRQFFTGIVMESGVIHAELPEETVRQNLEQAQQIYEEVKARLKPEQKLKEYMPRFSTESEITLFNVLNIENAKGLEKFLKPEHASRS